jgi:hypothetical protein
MAWTLHHHRATWVAHQRNIEVRLESPLRYSIGCNSSPDSDGELAAFEVTPWDPDLPLNIEPLACGDAYIRESDLIAFYPQTAPWTFGYQIDLRPWSETIENVQCMEIWLSISTSMLESNPKLVLRPTSPMIKLADGPISIASDGKASLIVHPLDLSDVAAVPLGQSSQVDRWDIFGGFMEKGVIRRARLLLAWGTGQIPRSTWEHALDRFADSPLPLTA